MKFRILFAGMILLPFLSNAQFGNESPIPYFRYSVTAGVGANQLYGDLAKRQVGPTGLPPWKLFPYPRAKRRAGGARGLIDGRG